MAYGGRNALDILVQKLGEIDVLFSSWESVKRDPKRATADARKALKKAITAYHRLCVEAEKTRQMLPEPPVGIRPGGGTPAKNTETRPEPAVATAETRTSGCDKAQKLHLRLHTPKED